jgi:protein gp37
MSDKSKIEWTDSTWNPIVGCSRVSQGCVNCYAERHAYRFARQAGSVYEGTARLVNGRPTFTGRVNLNARALEQPLRWRRGRRIFVNSMSDLFHENVPDSVIDRVFAIMSLAQQHTFQVLTKRPERAHAYLSRPALSRRIAEEGFALVCEAMERNPRSQLFVGVKLRGHIAHLEAWPLPNVWLGVSVEDQAAADERIPLLLKTPAAVRFLSCEPLLGPVSLTRIHAPQGWVDVLGGWRDVRRDAPQDEQWIENRVDWVIAGGESGPHARPMHPDWARSLRDQCAAASVPFLFKQHGEYREFYTGPETEQIDADDSFARDLASDAIKPTWLALDGTRVDKIDDIPEGIPMRLLERVGKKAAGRTLDGREHSEFPKAA